MKFLVLLSFALILQHCSASTKIINGELAKEGQFPHMVQLSIHTKDSNKYCGGSLLNSQWVLTAAHCCQKMTSATAYLGSTFMRSMLLKIKVVDVSVHPLYKDINDYDIALMKLEKTVVFNDRIKPVNLPSRTQNEDILRVRLLVPGFGETKNGSQSNLFLRYVQMQAIKDDECSDKWGWKVKDSLLCAEGLFSRNETTCQGDSGNGLVEKGMNESTIFGIVSYGAPGCVGKPKVFTKVSWYLDFIYSVTEMKILT